MYTRPDMLQGPQPISVRRARVHRAQRAGRKGPIGVAKGSSESGICCRILQRFQHYAGQRIRWPNS